MKSRLIFIMLILCSGSALSEVIMPHIFSDHMVLQQKQDNPIWGKATPGDVVTVSFASQNHKVNVDSNGDWKVKLSPEPVGEPYQIIVQSSSSKVEINDVLVGEVWLCSGQSNMEWSVKKSNHSAIEKISAKYPNIRLLSVPRVGTDEPQFDIDTKWKSTTPETIGNFSAVCYFYGRQLHQTLNIPVGLIKNSWGGSSIEAWLPRKTLEEHDTYKELLEHWDTKAQNFKQTEYEEKLKKYNAWKKSKKGVKVKNPENVLGGGRRPANIFNGVVNPFLGYGIRGVIWYQGETNSKRAYQYRSLFPLLINTWRELWGQGDFPFYWVQLADHKKEVKTPSEYSHWAELREAQTMTLSLPNTGQAVIFDLGEGRNIHPENKQDVAARLVRHPLAKIYGFDIMADSPMYQSMKIKGNKIVVSFSNVKNRLYAFDTKEVRGFYIAGKDQRFVRAQAKIVGKNEIEVFSSEIDKPVAVRYGWEDNPVVNLYDKSELPVTSFRTDDWLLKSYNVNK